MSMQQFSFEIRLKKVTFKQVPTSQQSFIGNLLYNNRKIDNTDPFQVPENQKSVDLSSLKPLIFNPKEDQDHKLPIFVYILYGQVSAKKIILKRADMVKKYDLQHKDTFQFDEDFGVFVISYQVILNKEQDVSKQQIQQKDQITHQNLPKPSSKVQQNLTRSFKRPSMLEVGQKVERIRKSSVDHRQTSQSQVNILSENSRQKQQKTNAKESIHSLVPPLTIVKNEETEQKQAKKDIKINLFENFGNLAKKPSENNPKQNTRKQQVHGSSYNQKAHQSHGSQKGSHHGHQENHEIHSAQKSHGGHDSHHSQHDSHKGHDSHGGHHDSHGGHHDSHGGHHGQHDEHSEPMSLKLKTVVAMLIIGFLFLMYDALDQRFSRKVRKLQKPHGNSQNHEHGHDGDHHEPIAKKKRGAKKNKVSTH